MRKGRSQTFSWKQTSVRYSHQVRCVGKVAGGLGWRGESVACTSSGNNTKSTKASSRRNRFKQQVELGRRLGGKPGEPEEQHTPC